MRDKKCLMEIKLYIFRVCSIQRGLCTSVLKLMVAIRCPSIHTAFHIWTETIQFTF